MNEIKKMETKITSGDWEVIVEKSGMYSKVYKVGIKNYYPECNKEGANLILFTAKKHSVPALNAEIEYNAKLISSAPELLEALTSMRAQLNQWIQQDKSTAGYEWAEKALNAIKKATL